MILIKNKKRYHPSSVDRRLNTTRELNHTANTIYRANAVIPIMGKKRNNAAKKKQGAKKKKISATYGVSVLKGGTIAKNNGIIETGNPMDVKSQNKQTAKSSFPKAMHSDESNAQQKQSMSNPNEHNEFQRQQASLEERSLIQQAQKKQQRKMKRQKKGWGNNFAQPSAIAPATFNLTKTTQQLVDDAANQVAQMSEIGQRLIAPAEGQSSLAAAAGSNWLTNIAQQKAELKAEAQKAQTNAFAALNDSDSENEWADGKQQKTPQFQFQPASFSFQSSFVAVGPSEEDIDPDL